MSIPRYHYPGGKPCLFDIDLKEMNCSKKEIPTIQPSKMSVYLPTIQASTDQESYQSYFVDYGSNYSCTLCYNMQIGLTGRPNMVSTLDERSPPLALKNGGSITNFKRHLSIFLSA
jgi:hypothetical protein